MIKNIVAVVDDSPVELNVFSSYVTRMGNEAVKVSKGQDIIDCFTKNKKIGGHSHRDVDVILLNLFMQDVNGVEILEEIKNKRGNTQIIVITGSTDKSLAIKAIALGAYDFIIKGDKEIFNKLSNSIINAIKKRNLKYQKLGTNLRVGSSVSISDIVSHSNVMEEVILSVKKAINSMIPALISGEDGSGRELIAKIIHDSSIRFQYPFSVIDCKNMTIENADKILFGYDIKNRNGQEKRVQGKIRAANKGTLYIENVEYLSRDTQTKLLNFIQYGEIEISQSIDLYTSNTRILASTCKNISQLFSDESNNLDLFEKLSTFTINVPNLCDRGAADIKLLANNFCNTFSVNENKRIKGITDAAMKILVNHRWERNIKQLRSAILQATILCDTEYLDAEHFPSITNAHGKRGYNANFNRFVDLFNKNGSHKTLSEIQNEIIQRFRKEFKYKPEEIIKYLNIKRKK
jgi:DNA-binding NtrC family response regulator